MKEDLLVEGVVGVDPVAGLQPWVALAHLLGHLSVESLLYIFPLGSVQNFSISNGLVD